MSEFSHIPLFDDWIIYSDGQVNTQGLFEEFVRQNLTAQNVSVSGSRVTALYSGRIGSNDAFRIAQDLAGRSGSDIRIIDDTNIGKFLNFILYDENGRSFVDFEITIEYRKARFLEASAKFALETNGAVIAITPNFVGDRVYSQVEVDNIIKSNATTINGRDLTEILVVADKIDDPIVRRAYVKAILDGDFARIVAQGDGNKLVFDSDGNVVLDFDQPTLTQLGIGDMSLSEPDTSLTNVINNKELSEQLSESRARSSEAINIALIKGDDTNINWKTISDPDSFGISQETSLIAKAIRTIETGGKLLDDGLVTIWREVLKVSASVVDDGERIVKDLARWQKAYIDSIPNLFDGLPDNLVNAGRTVVGHYQQYFDDTLGLFKFNGNVASYSAKITGAAAGVLLGGLDGVAEYKKAGGFTEEFRGWCAYGFGSY